MSDTVLITGANRGIGLQFVHHYLTQGAKVIATCRQPSHATQLSQLQERYGEQLQVMPLDVSRSDDITALATQLGDQPISLLINNAGIYGPRNTPLSQLNDAEWMAVLQTNSVAPLLVTQALLPHLQRSQQPKVAFISSKMGSMGDNGKGGSYIYRASKAALNAAVKSLAIDYAHDNLLVALLHPGWVQTDMGGEHAWITPEVSVSGMAAIIDSLNATQSGRFYAYDGQEIPW